MNNISNISQIIKIIKYVDINFNLNNDTYRSYHLVPNTLLDVPVKEPIYLGIINNKKNYNVTYDWIHNNVSYPILVPSIDTTYQALLILLTIPNKQARIVCDSYNHQSMGETYILLFDYPLYFKATTIEDLIETNLYYCKSRYYDPEVRRWISIDDISYIDNDSAVGINLWCYCNNNPVMYSDGDGTFAIATAVAIGFWIGFGIGALAGATAGGIIAYEYAKENEISGWGTAGLMTLGILGGGYFGGAIGGLIGSAIGYGIGVAFGGTQALVEGASIALYSGGGSSAAYNAASVSGKLLIRDVFAAKTLTFAQTVYPVLKIKAIYSLLWGKLSYDFALGAASAEIFLNGNGIYEKSIFYVYEQWALLERGVERIINYV